MPGKGRVPKPWSIADALETYGIHDWGNHYFHISDSGRVQVTPPGLEDHSIDLKELVDEVRQRGVGLPLLLRDRKSTRLNSSHLGISYAVFCLKKKINNQLNGKQREIVARLVTKVDDPLSFLV